MRVYLQLLFMLFASALYSQGNTCANADPFCSGTAEIFPNSTSGTSAEAGPDYGCLGSTPNPAWYYMQVGIAGDINLTISQETSGGTGLDVDFICWGPFATLDGSCNMLTSGNEVDCSYSTSAVENCNIPGAQVGDFYIVLITNFSGSAGTIDFQQTSGTGETDCNVLLPCFADAGSDDGFCAGGSALLGGFPTASGGSNLFTYTWLPATGLDDASIANPTATPTNTTTYTVTVDDGAGCVQTDDVTITIHADPVVDPGPDMTLDCLNSEVTLSSNNPLAASYTWTTADGNITSGAASDQAVVDAAGTYNLEVVSAEGCTGNNDVTVSLSDLDVDATITGPTELCQGEVGDFTITLDQPGNWGINYEIGGVLQPAVDITGTEFTYSSGQEGIHEVSFVTNDICTVDLIGFVDLQVEELPTVSFPTDNIFLCPGATESPMLTVTGEGDVTFGYDFDFVPQPAITTTAGLYTLPVSASGQYIPTSVSTASCVGTVDGDFFVSDVPEPTAVFQDDYTICFGETAQVAIDFTGTAPYNFTYAIDGVLQTAVNSPIDILELPITDAVTLELLTLEDTYCSATPFSSSQITVNPLPIATITGGDSYCSDVLVDLQIDLVGSGPFEIDYTLNGAPQTQLFTATSPYILQTMLPGDYQITGITDVLCSDGAQNNTVLEHFPPISALVNYAPEVCEGDTVTITALPSGGQSMGYDYLWTDANGATYTENPLVLEVLIDQNISLVVNDACDLPNNDGLVIMDVQAFPSTSFIALDDSLCVGEPVDFIHDAIDESVLCQWTFDDGTVLYDCDGVTHAFIYSGYQGVNLTTSTSAGCTTSLSVDSVLYVVPDAEAIFEAIGEEGTIFDPNVFFENTSTDAISYLWEFGDGEVSTEESPTHFYPGAISDLYPACLTAYNYLGCADTTCHLVIIEPEFLMSAPNTFTPDDDGLNDFFVPVFNDIVLAEYQLKIFDRFGAIVFESTDQFEHWNGSGQLGSNYYGTDAAYFYHVVTREINRSETREFFGEINILR